jgi:hypothetical protein
MTNACKITLKPVLKIEEKVLAHDDTEDGIA